MVGFREGDLKWIFDQTDQRDMLFDLRKDSLEKKNLAPGQPDLVARMRSRRQQEIDRCTTGTLVVSKE